MIRFDQLLRNTIVNETDVGASAIKALTSERIYPSELASIVDPTFPCLNFVIEVGPYIEAPDVFDGTMRTWCWSGQHEGSPDQAWELHDLLLTYWHQAAFRDDTLQRSVNLQQVGDPTRFTDPEARSYAVFARWSIYGQKEA